MEEGREVREGRREGEEEGDKMKRKEEGTEGEERKEEKRMESRESGWVKQAKKRRTLAVIPIDTTFVQCVNPISTPIHVSLLQPHPHLHQGDLPVRGQGVVEHLCRWQGKSPPRACLPQLVPRLSVQLILHL